MTARLFDIVGSINMLKCSLACRNRAALGLLSLVDAPLKIVRLGLGDGELFLALIAIEVIRSIWFDILYSDK